MIPASLYAGTMTLTDEIIAVSASYIAGCKRLSADCHTANTERERTQAPEPSLPAEHLPEQEVMASLSDVRFDDSTPRQRVPGVPTVSPFHERERRVEGEAQVRLMKKLKSCINHQGRQ